MKSENVNLCNTSSRGLRTSSAKRKSFFTPPLPGYAVLPPQGGQCKRYCALSTARTREATAVLFPMRGKVAEGRMRGKVNGFTLIELLVVVLIIGILAEVAVPQYQVAVAKARYTELMALVRHVKAEQEVFYLANGYYATDCKELGGDLPSGSQLNDANAIEDGGGKFLIKCAHNAGKNVAGMLLDSNADYLISYEQPLRYALDSDGNPLTYTDFCWANKNKSNVYKKVCETFCGYIEYPGDYPVCYR